MKFAYLIMAHDNPHQLVRLLKQLDWPENDIYLHLDKRSNCFDIDGLSKFVLKANLHLYRKFKVYWGDRSQTKCQIFLLEQALKQYHDYYHLLSGKDFPLKTHSEIISFFQRNQGKEFVHFESLEPVIKHNCEHYYVFDSLIRRLTNHRIRNILIKYQEKFIAIQKYLHIKPVLYAGANWYSITHGLAQDFIQNRRKVLRMTRFIKCSDEFVLQTYIMKISNKQYVFYKFVENDYESIVRKIDWNRGKPYVWRTDNYSELIQSDAIFGRKFDENMDKKIIDLLEEHNSH